MATKKINLNKLMNVKCANEQKEWEQMLYLFSVQSPRIDR